MKIIQSSPINNNEATFRVIIDELQWNKIKDKNKSINYKANLNNLESMKITKINDSTTYTYVIQREIPKIILGVKEKYRLDIYNVKKVNIIESNKKGIIFDIVTILMPKIFELVYPSNYSNKKLKGDFDDFIQEVLDINNKIKVHPIIIENETNLISSFLGNESSLYSTKELKDASLFNIRKKIVISKIAEDNSLNIDSSEIEKAYDILSKIHSIPLSYIKEKIPYFEVYNELLEKKVEDIILK